MELDNGDDRSETKFLVNLTWIIGMGTMLRRGTNLIKFKGDIKNNRLSSKHFKPTIRLDKHTQ